MHRRIFLIYFIIMSCLSLMNGQGYWQQEADYVMSIDVDVKRNQFKGTQTISYTNNSPDDLNYVFYHLYLNAFRPGSMMDNRNLVLADSDKRVGNRINELKPDEIGFQTIRFVKLNGVEAELDYQGTILRVDLPTAIKPGETVQLEMDFFSQIPLQIRRTGRDNKEGIQYSMSQWYPKLCEYDRDGWHPNPYIGREFYGVWGDFDVSIAIDQKYIVGASGLLQNPTEIGGYFAEGKGVSKDGKKTWHFLAENVHDFVWAADKDYTVITKESYDGTQLQFIYQPGEETDEVWAALPDIMVEAHKYLNERLGKYPYPIYSFIQGGDGGMEYPMATLITGERNLKSLVGVSVHEWVHSWYQMMMATDEAQYAWMDEGFTSFASTEVMTHLADKGMLPAVEDIKSQYAKKFQGFAGFALSGLEEPLSTHADHFDSNAAYGVGSYTKGAFFQRMLEGIIGESAFQRVLLRYYNEWKFKHPNANDYIRIAERESNLVLDWFQDYMVHMTKHPDYGVLSVEGKEIVLDNDGRMPMPIDVRVEYTDGSSEYFNIPLRIMRGHKTNDGSRTFKVLEPWPWTNPTYTFLVEKEVKGVHIDPEYRMLDVDRGNNNYEVLKP